jgi:hypothetical protein
VQKSLIIIALLYQETVIKERMIDLTVRWSGDDDVQQNTSSVVIDCVKFSSFSSFIH